MSSEAATDAAADAGQLGVTATWRQTPRQVRVVLTGVLVSLRLVGERVFAWAALVAVAGTVISQLGMRPGSSDAGRTRG